MFASDASLQPYLDQINQIEEQVSSLEQAAYKLDAYSKKLGKMFVLPSRQCRANTCLTSCLKKYDKTQLTVKVRTCKLRRNPFTLTLLRSQREEASLLPFNQWGWGVSCVIDYSICLSLLNGICR